MEKAAYKAECASYMERTTGQKQMLPFKSLSLGQMISFIPPLYDILQIVILRIHFPTKNERRVTFSMYC